MFMSRFQIDGENHNIKLANRSFEKWKVKIFQNDSNMSKFDS